MAQRAVPGILLVGHVPLQNGDSHKFAFICVQFQRAGHGGAVGEFFFGQQAAYFIVRTDPPG